MTMATPDEIEAMVAQHFDGFTPDEIEASTEDCCLLAKELRADAKTIRDMQRLLVAEENDVISDNRRLEARVAELEVELARTDRLHARVAALEGALLRTLECPWHCAAAHEARRLIEGKPDAD